MEIINQIEDSLNRIGCFNSITIQKPVEKLKGVVFLNPHEGDNKTKQEIEEIKMRRKEEYEKYKNDQIYKEFSTIGRVKIPYKSLINSKNTVRDLFVKYKKFKKIIAISESNKIVFKLLDKNNQIYNIKDRGNLTKNEFIQQCLVEGILSTKVIIRGKEFSLDESNNVNMETKVLPLRRQIYYKINKFSDNYMFKYEEQPMVEDSEDTNEKNFEYIKEHPGFLKHIIEGTQYLRLSCDNIHKPHNVVYYIIKDGEKVMLDPQKLRENKIISNTKPKEAPSVLSIKIDNITNVNKRVIIHN